MRVRVDGEILDVKNVLPLSKYKKHDIAAVIDRLIIKDSIRVRLADSIETALKFSEGSVFVLLQRPDESDWKEVLYSEKFACTKHPEASLEELSPRLFSFNSPYGACEDCHGLGIKQEFDAELIIPVGSAITKLLIGNLLNVCL